jgi:hypothetical protein
MRAAMVLATTLFLGAAATAQVERLDSEHQPFLRDFRASKDRARLIAILSPT